MVAPAALALGLVLAAQDDPVLLLGVRAEERTRSLFLETSSTPTHFLSLQATPRAALSIDGPDLRLAASYAPDLREPDFLTERSLQVMHRAEARLRAPAEGPWQLSASAAGAYGKADLLTERLEAASPEPIPTLAIIRYQEAAAALALTGAFDRRTRATLSARAFLSGGADREARASFPLERGLEAEGTLAWNATRGDLLTARVAARTARIAPSREVAAFALATGTWRHRFDPEWEGWAGGGVSVAYSELPGRSPSRELLPAAQAGLAFAATRPVRLEATLAGTASPYIDRYTARVDERIEANGTATWHISSDWALTGRGIGAMFSSRGLQRGVWSLASLGISWTVSRGLVLSVGATGQWQRADPGLGLPGFAEYGTFLAGSYETGRL